MKTGIIQGPRLPEGWGTLYSAEGLRVARVQVAHIPAAREYAASVLIGRSEHPLAEVACGTAHDNMTSHPAIRSRLAGWEVIFDSVIPE